MKTFKTVIFLMLCILCPPVAIVFWLLGLLNEPQKKIEIETDLAKKNENSYNFEVLPNGQLYFKEFDTKISLDKNNDELRALIKVAGLISTRNKIDSLYERLVRAKNDNEYEKILKEINKLERTIK